MKKQLLTAIYSGDLYATRFLLFLAELVWAITLFWPGDTFGRPTYIGMQRLMDEELWGCVFLTSSILQLHILKTHKFHTVFATVFAGWNSMLWLFVVVSMYMSVYPPPAGISGELALAFGACWVFVRSGSTVYVVKPQSQSQIQSHKHGAFHH